MCKLAKEYKFLASKPCIPYVQGNQIKGKKGEETSEWIDLIHRSAQTMNIWRNKEVVSCKLELWLPIHLRDNVVKLQNADVIELRFGQWGTRFFEDSQGFHVKESRFSLKVTRWPSLLQVILVWFVYVVSAILQLFRSFCLFLVPFFSLFLSWMWNLPYCLYGHISISVDSQAVPTNLVHFTQQETWWSYTLYFLDSYICACSYCASFYFDFPPSSISFLMQALLGFVNFKLYHSINVKYPPILDPRLEALAAGKCLTDETFSWSNLFY